MQGRTKATTVSFSGRVLFAGLTWQIAVCPPLPRAVPTQQRSKQPAEAADIPLLGQKITAYYTNGQERNNTVSNSRSYVLFLDDISECHGWVGNSGGRFRVRSGRPVSQYWIGLGIPWALAIDHRFSTYLT